jgi:Mg2+-importing ATPase
VESMSSTRLTLSTLLISVIAVVISFSDFAIAFDMLPMPLRFAPWLILLLLAYMLTVQLVKRIYIKRYGEWI